MFHNFTDFKIINLLIIILTRLRVNIIRTLTINYYSLLLNLRPTTDLFSEDQGQDDVEIE